MANKITDFKYVDFRSGEIKSKWTRTDNIIPLVEKCNHLDCFATIQRFKTLERESNEELFIAPLYFDFDYKEDPDVARLEVIKVCNFLTDELNIDSLAVRVYFSGSKGFHVIVNEKVFGIEPSNYIHKVFKYITSFLVLKLGSGPINYKTKLKTLDTSVYTVKRMLRIPNTKHADTGLFKVELSHDELASLNIDQIRQLAIVQRGSLYTDAQLNAANRFTKDAADFYEKHLKDYEDMSTYTKEASDAEFVFNKKAFPVCVASVFNKRWNPENRNNATMQLAAYCKTASYTYEEACDAILQWVTRFSAGDTAYEVEKRLLNTKNVVYTIYNSDNQYKFGCAFIRSLHGPKDESGNYERVPCAGTLCPFIKQDAVDNENVLQLRLADTGKSEYTGKLVRTKVMVAGKKSTPYIVPYRIKYSCYSNCDRTGCPLFNMPKKVAYKDLTNKDRALIQMCGVGDSNILGIIREVSGIMKCSKFELEVIESVNLEELLVIPMVTADDDNNNYVLRKIYSVGNTNIVENRYYELAGYVFPHPKNQEGTILIQSVKPLQDVVESFVYNEEVSSSLNFFKPNPVDLNSLSTKIDSLLTFLTYNITGIVERDHVLLGTLLVYHSALKLNVPWDSTPIRGWLETIIIGDTGTGKSAMVEKLMKYVGLGQRVNAESTSRTGLTYKMEQSNSGSWYIVWGAWPLCDKGLIWIDEASGIPKEEYGQMTLARSSGKLEVKRAVTAETNCRVRAILTTNAVKGKRLSDYIQGVESLKYMFNNEDIRRFDFALFMKATDVAVDKYNTLLETTESSMTATQLKNNILFAWSRTPDQVTFTEAAINLILSYATTLSKKFGHATDVPIVSPSDQRNKLVRLSASLALLVHSVKQEDDSVVIVENVHVEFIYNYLMMIYSNSSCGLHNYVKMAVREEILDDEHFLQLSTTLKEEVKVLSSDLMFTAFIKIFASQSYLRLGDIEALLCLERNDVKLLIQVLAKLRMLVSTTSGYRKTPRFNSFIDKCFIDGIIEADNE